MNKFLYLVAGIATASISTASSLDISFSYRVVATGRHVYCWSVPWSFHGCFFDGVDYPPKLMFNKMKRTDHSHQKN